MSSVSLSVAVWHVCIVFLLCVMCHGRGKHTLMYLAVGCVPVNLTVYSLSCVIVQVSLTLTVSHVS